MICGDYQLPGDGAVAVDTKKDIAELIGDIQFKAMAKKDIMAAIVNIWSKNNIAYADKDFVYKLITDDDYDRFVEKELSDYCFEKYIPENVLKELQALYVKRHGFFHRGLIRAKYYGVKLYILVENTDGVTDINSLFKWVNPRSRIMIRGNEVVGWTKGGEPKYNRVRKYPHCMQGSQLAKACLTMQLRYGCTFQFCTPEQSGKRIVELLTNYHSPT